MKEWIAASKVSVIETEADAPDRIDRNSGGRVIDNSGSLTRRNFVESSIKTAGAAVLVRALYPAATLGMTSPGKRMATITKWWRESTIRELPRRILSATHTTGENSTGPEFCVC